MFPNTAAPAGVAQLLEVAQMIVTAQKDTRTDTTPPWHAEFLEMLPTIRRQASIAFRHVNPEAREDAVGLAR